MTSTVTSNEINLSGSTKIVQEFFYYSINSILYQRGIYPPETFSKVQKYGLVVLVSQDEGLKGYLDQVLRQLSDWLMMGEVQRLVLVITGVDTKQTLERWVFNVDTDKEVVASPSESKREKSDKDIMNEIQAIMRQICASVSFLPLLEEPCTFDLLVYADREAQVPKQWEESDPKYIANSTDVRLRSFTTTIHKVDTCVTYRNGDDEDV